MPARPQVAVITERWEDFALHVVARSQRMPVRLWVMAITESDEDFVTCMVVRFQRIPVRPHKRKVPGCKNY